VAFVPAVLSVVKVVDFVVLAAAVVPVPNVPGPFVTVAVIVQPAEQILVPATVVVSPAAFLAFAVITATAAGVTTPVRAFFPADATTAESFDVAKISCQ